MENILMSVASVEKNTKHVQEILGLCLVFVTSVATCNRADSSCLWSPPSKVKAFLGLFFPTVI